MKDSGTENLLLKESCLCFKFVLFSYQRETKKYRFILHLKDAYHSSLLTSSYYYEAEYCVKDLYTIMHTAAPVIQLLDQDIKNLDLVKQVVYQNAIYEINVKYIQALHVRESDYRRASLPLPCDSRSVNISNRIDKIRHRQRSGVSRFNRPKYDGTFGRWDYVAFLFT